MISSKKGGKGKMERKEKMIVRKSNQLLINKQSYSLPEMKILLVMLSRINKMDKDFKTYSLFFNEFLDLRNREGRKYSLTTEYNQSKKIVQGLQKKLIEIEKPNGKMTSVQIIGKVDFYENYGYIDYTFDREVKHQLLNLQRDYTLYDISNLLPCKSKHSIIIYHLDYNCLFRHFFHHNIYYPFIN